jgi:uncharacterized protein
MKSYTSSLIICIAIVITSLILANAFKHRNNSKNSIQVTGLGQKDFISDLVVWTATFNRKSADLKSAYAALDQDRATINQFLQSKGMTNAKIIFTSVDIQKEFDEQFDASGRKTHSVFTGFQLKQNVQIESKEVDKVEAISRQVSELINSGVEIYSNPPQYFYTKLAELKIQMIAEATKDAYNRAKKIAENAGGGVGNLKNASMGVFQIVAQNSSEDYAWSGSFNTNSKEKTATITIKLDYEAQ